MVGRRTTLKVRGESQVKINKRITLSDLELANQMSFLKKLLNRRAS